MRLARRWFCQREMDTIAMRMASAKFIRDRTSTRAFERPLAVLPEGPAVVPVEALLPERASIRDDVSVAILMLVCLCD